MMTYIANKSICSFSKIQFSHTYEKTNQLSSFLNEYISNMNLILIKIEEKKMTSGVV